MARHGGSTSRARRTARRHGTPGVKPKQRPEPKLSLVAAASGATDLPLSDRETSWDAGAAEKSLSTNQYGDAHFWRDPDGDPETLAAYKLPFATNDRGLTAVWKGVTASAGAVQGARGGVSIPESDVGGVKTRIGGYYAKARDKYDDPNIVVPWEASADTSAAILDLYGLAPLDDDPCLHAAVALAHAEALGGKFLFNARLGYWQTQFAPAALTDDSSVPGEHVVVAEHRPRSAGPPVKPGPAPVSTDGTSIRRAVLAAAGIEDVPPDPTTTYELTVGGLGERCFYAEAIRAGYTVERRASWPSEADLGEHGDVLYQGDNEAVFRLPNGALVHGTISYGWARFHVSAPTGDEAGEAIGAFSVAYPPLYREQEDNAGIVPITFWSDSKWGPTSRLRMIDAATWEDIARNYSGPVRTELERLVDPDFEPGKDGQLILWQGDPGTGKTWALRALASEWRDWAEFHYITDPDAFFVSNASYMVDVLLADTYDELMVTGTDGPDSVVTSVREGGKWRVLILEDTGELLSANAKEAYGQGLSRLLNVVDGMVGQGLRVLALVTTNDELGELHPAAVRPGRCASQIKFGPLDIDEAREWLGEDHADVEVDTPLTIAELYQASGHEPAPAFQADGECQCGHMADQHDGGDGACSVQECACQGYEPSMAAAASRLTMEFDIIGDTPLAPELAPRAEMPPMRPGPAAPITEQPTRASMKRWTATLCPEGVMTDDGRMFQEGSVTWRNLPLTLMAMLETQDGHDGARVAGRIDRIWREGNLVRGEGVFDESEFGDEIARMVAEGVLRGVSVDIAIREYEIVSRAEIEANDGEVPDDGAEVDLIDLLFGEGDVVFLVTDGVIGAVTVCPFPAFADAEIALAAAAAPAVWVYTHQAGFEVTAADDSGLEAVTASAIAPDAVPVPVVELEQEPAPAPAPAVITAAAAGMAPVAPPAEWFSPPDLEELTPLVVTSDGRVYGHIAAWDFCHIAIPDSCTIAPHSATGYAYFNTGEIECEQGERIACGQITLGTGHADPKLGRAATVAHYDHTGTAAVDCVAGEDEFGIWVAGAVRPDVDAETVRALRASTPSGDWRSINGNLELVAVLAVNVPGFPVPRPRALIAAGDEGEYRVLALTAAGLHDGRRLSDLEAAQIARLAGMARGGIAALVDRARG